MNGDDSLVGGSSDDRLFGMNGDDSLVGGDGNDYIVGGPGADLIDGGDGSDSANYYDAIFSGVTVDLRIQGISQNTGGGGFDTLTSIEDLGGSPYSDVLIGNNSANKIYDYYGGNDLLIGGGGNDDLVVGQMFKNTTSTLQGGDGDDVIRFFGPDDLYPFGLGPYITSASLDGGNGADEIHSSGLCNDTLDGGAGADSLFGGNGNDIYYVDNVGDYLAEAADQGADTVHAIGISYGLAANFETLILDGSANINATGNSLANSLSGNSGNNKLDGKSGNDTLDGGAGADTLIGGGGDDLYIVDNSGDVITEYFNNGTGGVDTVQSSVSYTLATNVENPVLTGAAAINGIGNAASNVITGNGSANSLTGGNGSDTIDGGAGADTMVGGIGNDIYYVDDAGDIVTEAPSAGTDTVHARVSYALTDDVEKLILDGSTAINGIGNALANTLTGNNGNNILDGGAGIDTMTGGIGNDFYVVDSTSDVIVEVGGQGADSVSSSVTYTLSANVEKLTLTGTADINGIGNGIVNYIAGNSGANSLSGGGGNDTLDAKSGNDTLNGGTGADSLQGGNGDDFYIVDNVGDIVTEYFSNGLGGVDNVQSGVSYTLADNVEKLLLTGSAAISGTGNTLANTLTGNSGANTLSGLAGKDTLDGGAGIDSLTGGTGSDVFLFQAGQANGDTITDFVGNGASAGDVMLFQGYGAGAFATVGAGIVTISYSGGSDVIHLDTTGLDASDYSFA